MPTIRGRPSPRAHRSFFGFFGGGVPLLLVLLFGLPAPASGHLGHVVRHAERYLKIEVASDHVRIVISLTLGPEEALRVKQAADGDGDGRVTSVEADTYLAAWGKGLEADLPLTVDGVVQDVSWGQGYFGPVGPISPEPATAEISASVPLAGGTRRVYLDDRMRVETFERTDVVFQAREGVTLLRAGLGSKPEGTPRTVAVGPLTRCPLTVEARLPDEDGSFARTSALAVALVLLLLAATVFGIRWRRRG